MNTKLLATSLEKRIYFRLKIKCIGQTADAKGNEGWKIKALHQFLSTQLLAFSVAFIATFFQLVFGLKTEMCALLMGSFAFIIQTSLGSLSVEKIRFI